MEACKTAGGAAMRWGMDRCSRMMGTGASAGKEEQTMDEKVKELIAIGASIGAHCQPCLTHHVDKARELGIDEELIKAAVETGHMVERGAMNAMRKFSSELLAPKTDCAAGACTGGGGEGSPCCG